MTLLKDLTVAAIYDWFAHKGAMLLKESGPAFGEVVLQSLRASMGDVKSPMPAFPRADGFDEKLEKGLTHKDLTEIAGHVKSFVSSLSPGSGPEGAERFMESVFEHVKENFPIRAALKTSVVTKDLLVDALKGNDKDEKIQAILLLGEIDSEETNLLLYDFLQDRDPDLRVAAIHAMAGMGSESSVPYILELLHDPEISVRGAAVGALMQLRSKEAIDALIDVVICEDDEPVRVRAITALFDLASTEAADKLAEVAQSHVDPVCCNRAREAISRLGGKAETTKE
ncbi:MAG TPA: HEAT repeat domain-containing protein [Syntrophorhabdaceae bacterium]|jgi:hypothetical protein